MGSGKLQNGRRRIGVERRASTSPGASSTTQMARALRSALPGTAASAAPPVGCQRRATGPEAWLPSPICEQTTGHR